MFLGLMDFVVFGRYEEGPLQKTRPGYQTTQRLVHLELDGRS